MLAKIKTNKTFQSAHDFYGRHHAAIKDILIALAAIFVFGVIVYAANLQTILNRAAEISGQIRSIPEVEEDKEEDVPAYPVMDTAEWQEYENKYYGFELKYPQSMAKPVGKNASKDANWVYRAEFRYAEAKDGNSYVGFDAVIYDVKKTKELSSTEEYPVLKSQDLAQNENCTRIEGHIYENPTYPAGEVFLPPDDECFAADYFYTLTRDSYIYNFIAVKKDGEAAPENPKKEVLETFPEFYNVATSINLIEIERPKPKPKPVITAPKPADFKWVNGRMVCSKKNDKPSYSDKTSHKHLDMECCLDPDEYPNPWCYYDPGKYGKYL